MGLKGIKPEQLSHHLRKGEQRSPAFVAINPQGLVPALELQGGEVLTQSLAICEYLDETVPLPPLLPADPLGRAKVRALAQIVACDIHPVQNLKILDRLQANGVDQDAVRRWAQIAIEEGLAAFEQRIAGMQGRFCFGDQPTLADLCLVPQLGNARRFGVNLDFPRILSVEAECGKLQAFIDAAPQAQADAE